SGGAWGTSFASGTSDATGYVENLIDRRIQANRWDWYGPALFSTALSFRFWESLWMDLRFLAGGPRVIHPWSYTHNGWRITPPLVELAYTPWGAWHQMHLPIQTPGGWQIETLFGHDVDWMAAGQLRTWRIGANLSTPSWPLGQCRLRYELGGAYTLRHSPMAYAGYATHATLRLQMRRLEISLEARRSEGDLEENGIHARPEGMEIYSGMSWLY
ncbi:MAG TPA: hypothetical protein VLM37_06320, partial [Fibrobacteraceae bacterium]|nr:hypothetical protein [Fibrobacteraceae bacterium]